MASSVSTGPAAPSSGGQQQQQRRRKSHMDTMLPCSVCDEKGCATEKCPKCADVCCTNCFGASGTCRNCEFFADLAETKKESRVTKLFSLFFREKKKPVDAVVMEDLASGQTSAKVSPFGVKGLFKRMSTSTGLSLNFNDATGENEADLPHNSRGSQANHYDSSSAEAHAALKHEVEKYKKLIDALQRERDEYKARAKANSENNHANNNNNNSAPPGPGSSNKDLVEARERVVDLEVQVQGAKAEILDLGAALLRAQQREHELEAWAMSLHQQQQHHAQNGGGGDLPAPPVTCSVPAEGGGASSPDETAPAPLSSSSKPTFSNAGKPRSEIPPPPPFPPGMNVPLLSSMVLPVPGTQARRGSAPAVLIVGPHLVRKANGFGIAPSVADLKPIYWTALEQTKIQGTIWEKVPSKVAAKPEVLERHLAQLSARFTKKPAALQKAGSVVDAAALQNAAPRPRILDDKRKQQIGISLHGLKSLSMSQLRAALVSFDPNVLTTDRVVTLFNMIPTAEEIKLIDDLRADGQLDKNFFKGISKEESFIIETASIPRLRHRMNCVLTELKFPSLKESLEEELDAEATAIARVRDSKKLIALLHLCLETGNFLNEGSKRGGAWGISLDSVAKLAETKAADNNRYSLLHWIAEVAASTQPELFQLEEEFAVVEMAKNLSVEDLRASVNHFKKQMEHMKKELDEARKNDKVEGADAFLKKMVPFYEKQLVPQVQKVVDQMAQIEKDAEQLILLHGEIPQATTCKKLFELILNGVKMFIECHKENVVNQNATKKLQQQQQASAAGGGNNPAKAKVAASLAGTSKTLDTQLKKDNISRLLNEKSVLGADATPTKKRKDHNNI